MGRKKVVKETKKTILIPDEFILNPHVKEQEGEPITNHKFVNTFVDDPKIAAKDVKIDKLLTGKIDTSKKKKREQYKEKYVKKNCNRCNAVGDVLDKYSGCAYVCDACMKGFQRG